MAALDAGDFDAAVAQLTTAARLAPGAIAIGRQLGEAQAASGDLDGARATLDRLAARAPDNAAVLVDLAHVCQIIGDGAAARAAIERAAALQPDDPATRLAQARLYESQGELALAVATFGELVRLAPVPGILTNLARLYLAQGQYREADAVFRQLGALDPDAELVARHGRIWSQLKRGDSRSGLEQALGAARADRYDLTTALLAYARDRLFTRVPQEEITMREAALDARFAAELRDYAELYDADPLVQPLDDGEEGARG
jgi:tetratricopeptide (TPR) repeat protein